MASRSFNQFLFSLIPGYTQLNAQFTVGSTGAVTTNSTQGSGIQSIVRLAAGTYRINLQDVYNRCLGVSCSIQSPVTGSTAAGSLNPTTVYVIATMGTTTQANWVTAGVPSNVTAAVGVSFLCAATTSGNGTCSVPASSGDYGVEVIGNPNLTIIASPNNAGTLFPYIDVQCMGPTDATHPAPIPVDPVSGSILKFMINLRNSSLKAKGE